MTLLITLQVSIVSSCVRLSVRPSQAGSTIQDGGRRRHVNACQSVTHIGEISRQLFLQKVSFCIIDYNSGGTLWLRPTVNCVKVTFEFWIPDNQLINLGPDLQNILRQSYDYLTIMPTSNLQNILRRTQGFSLVRFTRKIVRSSDSIRTICLQYSWEIF